MGPMMPLGNTKADPGTAGPRLPNGPAMAPLNQDRLRPAGRR